MSGAAEGTAEHTGIAGGGPRFLSIKAVADELAGGESSVRTLIKTGELPAIQIGGRGVWRVERAELEGYIARQYVQAESARESLDNAEEPDHSHAD